MSNRSFDELMRDYTRDRLNGEELQRFLDMTQQEPHKQELKDYIGRLLHDRSASGLADGKRADVLLQNILAAARAPEAPSLPLPERRNTRKLWLVKSMAAALLVAVAAAAVWMFVYQRSNLKPMLAQRPKNEPAPDVMPGSQKALLTLGNGTVITLDDAANGALAKQGTATVIKLNGQLNYKPNAGSPEETVYNTISTPRGGQYQVVLPDGSQVWLNAASSLYFPTAFAAKERKVEITGEAYFEVARKKGQPFVVAVNGSVITVTGTHFSVMAYADEATLETTLFEGAVQFSHNSQTVLLKPLEQSRLKKDGRLDMINGLDEGDVLAWKNGLFHFADADLQTVMRALARWYDVEVEYHVTPDDNLYDVEMPRTSKLSSVLKVLEITANVHLAIEGRKIIVS